MALPLLFAACSQDEFVNENVNPSLGNRKTVGNVTINFNDAETRMAFGGKTYNWEAGDQFGACLMDEMVDPSNAYDGETFWQRFKLVDYIHTNYPFTRDANGVWKAEAVMSEGNYFYYYPFNYNLGGRRSAIKLEVPAKQALAEGAKASSALNNQLFVGYAPVVAEEGKEKESVTVTMEPLLAFPGFRIENTGTKTTTIEKIALVAKGGFATSLEIKPAAGSFDNAGFARKNANDQRKEILKTVAYSNEDKAAKVELVFEGGKTLGTHDKALGYIMMPAGELEEPKLYIYTDRGLGIADLSEVHTDAGTGAINITNDRILTEVKYNDGAVVNLTFDDTAFDQPLGMPVNSTDELVDLVKWSKDNTKAELVATLTSDDVELTNEVRDMLAANDKISLEILGAGYKLNIPADAKADVLSYVNIDEDVTIFVKEGASIKVPAEDANIENEGTIELVSNEEYATIDNKGIVNITGKKVGNTIVANISILNNEGTVNVNAKATTIATLNNNTDVDGDNKANGTLNIAEGATLNATNLANNFIDNGNKTYSRGIITVNGTLKVSGQNNMNNGLIVNNGEICASGTGKLVNETANWVANYGWIDSAIDNYGVISGVENHGMIDMKVENARLTTTSASDGEIDNTILSPYVKKQAAETIVVTVAGDKTTSELAELVKKSNAKKLAIEGTITPDKVDNELITEIVGEQDVLKVVTTGDLTINGTINFRGQDKAKTVFEVSEYTTAVVVSGATLKIGGKAAADKGTIYVDGKLLIQGGATVIAKLNPGDASNVENFGTWE